LAAAIAEGKTFFEKVGCSTCHSGARFTNNKNEDIGFGTGFQTPTLIDVRFRPPYLRDGSAATLEDFLNGPFATKGKRGDTSELSPEQVDELTVYVESL
jgi:cytochrome c peroxidase